MQRFSTISHSNHTDLIPSPFFFHNHQSDANKDGSLDYHEFMRFVRSLDLKLSTREGK